MTTTKLTKAQTATLRAVLAAGGVRASDYQHGVTGQVMRRTVRKYLEEVLRPERGAGNERIYERARVEALAAERAANPPQRGRPKGRAKRSAAGAREVVP